MNNRPVVFNEAPALELHVVLQNGRDPSVLLHCHVIPVVGEGVLGNLSGPSGHAHMTTTLGGVPKKQTKGTKSADLCRRQGR